MDLNACQDPPEHVLRATLARNEPLHRVQPVFEFPRVRSAAAVLGTVGKLHEVLPVFDSTQFRDTASLDDSRAVDTQKLGRVEFLLE